MLEPCLRDPERSAQAQSRAADLVVTIVVLQQVDAPFSEEARVPFLMPERSLASRARLRPCTRIDAELEA